MKNRVQESKDATLGLVGGLRKRNEADVAKYRDEIAHLEQQLVKKDADLKEILRASNRKIDTANGNILALTSERDTLKKKLDASEKEFRTARVKFQEEKQKSDAEVARLTTKNKEMLSIVQQIYDNTEKQVLGGDILAMTRESLDAFTKKWS